MGRNVVARIRQAPRRKYSVEEMNRIAMDGGRGEIPILEDTLKRSLFLVVLLALQAYSPPPILAQGDPPVRRITLRECVETALRNNIDIAVSQAEKEIGALAVPIEEAAFLPAFTGELNASQSISPNSSALDNSPTVDQRFYKFNLGVTELLATGTSFSLVQENQRQESSSAVSLLSPQYVTGLTLSARQPLLKNRGKAVTEAPLRIARAGAAEKTEEWKSKVMDIVTAARTAFLSFVAAVRDVEVRRSAVELAERVVVHTDARIQAGAAATMDLLPAESAVATRREELLRAEAAAGSAEVDLKSLLGVRSSREWEERFVPVPLTEEIPPPGDKENFEEAVLRRPEVAAIDARRTQAEIREAADRNRTLPALDLTVSAGVAGLSGTPSPNPLFGGNADAFSGNYRDSVDRMFSGRYYNWLVGLKTELPWGFRREKAEWARSKVALREQRLLEDAVFLRIRVEVQKRKAGPCVRTGENCRDPRGGRRGREKARGGREETFRGPVDHGRGPPVPAGPLRGDACRGAGANGRV